VAAHGAGAGLVKPSACRNLVWDHAGSLITPQGRAGPTVADPGSRCPTTSPSEIQAVPKDRNEPSTCSLRKVRQTARLWFSSAGVIMERPWTGGRSRRTRSSRRCRCLASLLEHATDAVLAASETCAHSRVDSLFLVWRRYRKSAFDLVTKLRRSAVKSESGEFYVQSPPILPSSLSRRRVARCCAEETFAT
jgi:hypothetical protein